MLQTFLQTYPELQKKLFYYKRDLKGLKPPSVTKNVVGLQIDDGGPKQQRRRGPRRRFAN